MLHFHISTKQGNQDLEHAAGPIEFGRGPRRDNVARFVIAGDLSVSRNHAQIEELAGGRIRVQNLSDGHPITVASGTPIGPQASRDLALPVRLVIGESMINIKAGGAPPGKQEPLETISRPQRSILGGDAGKSLLHLGQSPSPETLTSWFETVIAVQRAAAGSAEFYEQTARALVELVGLDSGLVLLNRGGQWEIAAQAAGSVGPASAYSRTILEHVVAQGRTFYQSSAPPASESLKGVEAVVVSPIFDPTERVVGAVYGCRTRAAGGRGVGIGVLEAQVVQLLASAVGAGLARQQQEAEVGRQRAQFDQFFSPELAEELQRNPDLLKGQERPITVLFSDIRSFSRLSERLGPVDTCRLVADVMQRQTLAIRECKGVVVGYLGDGLMAMWNAPKDQPDHAALACRAALAMYAELPNLSRDWAAVTGGPLKIGIGINTGPAMVGNTGSQIKFNYGPLGHTVNLASRVEGATKQLGIPILITGSTQALLDDSFATRRLCKVRVVGIGGAVDLYELDTEKATPEWLARRDSYESALKLFEAGKWVDAYRALARLLDNEQQECDIPALDLVERAVECLKSPPEKFDPIKELVSK